MAGRLVLLGVGKTAQAVSRAAHGYTEIVGTTRSIERLPDLEELGMVPILVEYQGGQLRDQQALGDLISGAHVLVSFPPDEVADRQLSQLSSEAASLVYISSTGVYGRLSGEIDESSPTDLTAAASRLQAEALWRQRGAVVLRAAGLYDMSSGLHKRLQAGTYRIPGDGSNYVSRIHLDDLAQIILAALQKAKPGSIYVAADSRPATHREVAQWLCDRLKLQLPATVPLDMVHETLRGNRRINAKKVLLDLGVQLRYPSFIEGYESMFAEI